MADRTAAALERPAKPAKGSKKATASGEQRERVFDAFRRWGYYQATLDPLGVFAPTKHPDLAEWSGAEAAEARSIYCGNIGAEFMHMPEPERRRWIAERIEGPQTEVNRERILERLVRARGRGVKIEVMARAPHTLKRDKVVEGVGGLRILDDVGIKVHKLKHLKLHGNALLRDGTAAIVGSINLATAALTAVANSPSRCATRI